MRWHLLLGLLHGRRLVTWDKRDRSADRPCPLEAFVQLDTFHARLAREETVRQIDIRVLLLVLLCRRRLLGFALIFRLSRLTHCSGFE